MQAGKAFYRAGGLIEFVIFVVGVGDFQLRLFCVRVKRITRFQRFQIFNGGLKFSRIERRLRFFVKFFGRITGGFVFVSASTGE